MRSPADMEVIQIEITNACLHSCSNCTRLCGHHQRPFFMDWDTFQLAVNSLSGYDGIIGMMGGEPTLHPDFERMTKYLFRRHGMSVSLKAARRPVTDFLTYTRTKHNANRVLNKCKGPGLWTSMPKQYYRYYELIQDSFVFQCLNDHHHPSFHQPLLVARKDLGVPDAQWIKLRDKCWIQNNWSASISPKGAFFCEVAASLDMLFNGPGGWPIEANWWRRKPSDFGDQLQWCEMCGAALDTKRRDANEQNDDVSPTMIKRLQAVNSPKLNRGFVQIFPSDNETYDSAGTKFKRFQYIDKFSHRLGTANLNLLPKSITAIIHWNAPKTIDESLGYLELAIQAFDNVVLVVDHNINEFNCLSAELIKRRRIKVYYGNKDGLGEILHAILHALPNPDWFLFFSCDQRIPGGLPSNLKESYINPGVMHHFSLTIDKKCPSQSTDVFEPGVVFFLFNHIADALSRAGKKNIVECTNWDQFKNLWPTDKRLQLSVLPEELPATDEQEWMLAVDDDILDDKGFCRKFATVLADRVSTNSNLLVTQSASFFLTRALIRILVQLDYTVYLITHQRFSRYFNDVLPPHQIIIFSHCERIKFDCLKELCEDTKNAVPFSGAVVPYSSPRSIIEPEDGYQNIEKVAAFLADRIVCGVNLKRQFVSGHKDHRSIYENRWGY